jgi:hypothetical protein
VSNFRNKTTNRLFGPKQVKVKKVKHIFNKVFPNLYCVIYIVIMKKVTCVIENGCSING